MSPLIAVAWFSAVGVPALLAVGGLVAWGIRSTVEENRVAERSLTDERRELYERVLEPFMLVFTSADANSPATQAAQQEILMSAAYKRAVFELTLVASDEVVRAFGEVTNAASNPAAKHPLAIWARLILSIRKSVGNKGTQLSKADILRPMITDLDGHPEILKALSER